MQRRAKPGPKNKIYTCADSLRDENVLRVISPDVGSLPGFMGGSFDLSARKAPKKSKAEIEEQQWNESLEDLKKMMNFEKKTLKELLIHEKDDRKRQGAGRLIIEDIFETVFSASPD
jgi:hypothetical protein